MPPHSAESEKINRTYFDYLDYLESLKNYYSSIYVSIFYLDRQSKLVSEIERRGLMYIDGARPDDAYSLQRMRAIFDSFEYVTSNTMGSHIPYALYCGCKTSLCGPMFSYDETMFYRKNHKIQHNKNYIQDIIYYHSTGYLQKNFNFLFTFTPKDGYISEYYGKKEIGYYNILGNNEIMKILKWDFPNQITGYSSGGIRRLKRTTKLLQNKFQSK